MSDTIISAAGYRVRVPDLDPLLRAVRAAPDDLEVLAAYADALVGRGEPLGELIRVACALAGAVAAEARAGLVAREQALLAAHEDAWLGPLRDVVDHHVWWRGMLGLDVSVAGFLRRHADLGAAPAVRFVDVSDWSADLEAGAWRALVACPDLRWVTLLGVRGRYCHDGDEALLRDEDAASLAASEHARGLIGLDLGFNAIGDAGLVAIARSPHLAGLRSLALRGCRYGDAGLLALANEATFVGLETLDLSYCDGPRGDGDGWRALAASQRFPRLRWLGSRGSPVPEDVQAALAGRGADDEPEY